MYEEIIMRTRVSLRWSAVMTLVAFFCAAHAQEGIIPNRGEPLENVTTGGQPDVASLESLADSGYTTVIDLRRPQEERGIDEQAEVEGLGMSYVSIPIDGANGVTYENAELLNQILGQAQGPVLIHCGSGNRAGALLSLSEKLNGADNETALSVGRAGGLTRLESTVLERLESGP
jgi:uncharacterized protein (TIGR01244 family)